MADDIDKFVLEYKVETKDAEAGLNRLQDKVEKVGKASGKSMKDFAAGAVPEFGKMAGAVDTVKAGIGAISGASLAATAGIGAMAAAVGVLVVALKIARSQMDDLNRKFEMSTRLGVGQVTIENMQRNLVKARGSRVSSEEALTGMNKLSDLVNSAASNPNKMSRENVLLSQAGVSATDVTGRAADLASVMNQLSESFARMPKEKAEGIAIAMGLTAQYADSLRELNGQTSAQLHMTDDEIIAAGKAAEAAKNLQSSENKLGEDWRELKNVIGVELIPVLDSAVQKVTEWAKALKDIPHPEKGANEVMGKALAGSENSLGGLLMGFIQGRVPWSAISNALNKDLNKPDEQPAQSPSEKHDAAKKVIEDQNASAKTTQESTIAFNQSVNLFAQAAASFASVVDDRQAWAAWAGEVGRASGLAPMRGSKDSGDYTDPRTGAGSGAIGIDFSTQARQMGMSPMAAAADKGQYDSLIEAAAKKYGVDPTLAKKIISQESKFNPHATSSEGAQGLMQVMPSNFKALGITDGYDATQNIFGGMRILAESLKRAKGDVNLALRYYNGGLDQSKWGPVNAAYPGNVLSQNVRPIGSGSSAANGYGYGGDMTNAPAALKTSMDPNAQPVVTFGAGRKVNYTGGESMDTMRRKAVADMVAGALGIPVGQLMLGDVTKGDVRFAESNVGASLLNKHAQLEQQLSVPGILPMQRASMIKDLQTVASQIQMMQQYGNGLVESAQNGGRALTIGEMPVTVNVQGSGLSTAQIAREAAGIFEDSLRTHLHELANDSADGIRY
ncbi:lytic transglycosylase domain-containing protein [Caballeronia sp. DA-9]|uniref:lytic transglycosylase domain-containing protein n=1 Tax=Caballeronia sp. DA-9 TaxID=3436237 RepID=UPI003F663AF2